MWILPLKSNERKLLKITKNVGKFMCYMPFQLQKNRYKGSQIVSHFKR